MPRVNIFLLFFQPLATSWVQYSAALIIKWGQVEKTEHWLRANYPGLLQSSSCKSYINSKNQLLIIREEKNQEWGPRFLLDITAKPIEHLRSQALLEFSEASLPLKYSGFNWSTKTKMEIHRHNKGWEKVGIASANARSWLFSNHWVVRNGWSTISSIIWT